LLLVESQLCERLARFIVFEGLFQPHVFLYRQPLDGDTSPINVDIIACVHASAIHSLRVCTWALFTIVRV